MKKVRMGVIGSLEVTKYDYKLIDGDPKIVISMVKVSLPPIVTGKPSISL